MSCFNCNKDSQKKCIKCNKIICKFCHYNQHKEKKNEEILYCFKCKKCIYFNCTICNVDCVFGLTNPLQHLCKFCNELHCMTCGKKTYFEHKIIKKIIKLCDLIKN